MSDATTPGPEKPAAQVEAEGDQTITIAWEGTEMVLPATVDDMDPDVLESFQRGADIVGLRLLIGSEAYDKLAGAFKAKHGRKWKVRDIKALGQLVAAHYGFTDPGN